MATPLVGAPHTSLPNIPTIPTVSDVTISSTADNDPIAMLNALMLQLGELLKQYNQVLRDAASRQKVQAALQQVDVYFKKLQVAATDREAMVGQAAAGMAGAIAQLGMVVSGTTLDAVKGAENLLGKALTGTASGVSSISSESGKMFSATTTEEARRLQAATDVLQTTTDTTAKGAADMAHKTQDISQKIKDTLTQINEALQQLRTSVRF